MSGKGKRPKQSPLEKIIRLPQGPPPKHKAGPHEDARTKRARSRAAARQKAIDDQE